MVRLYIFVLLIIYPNAAMEPASAYATLIEKIDQIPSGSGIELADGKLYIIGDDSPDLFIMNVLRRQKYETVKLLNGENSSRIKKPVKPDFEAITSLKKDDSTFLYIFGSGGIAPHREKLIIADITDQVKTKTLSLSTFYAAIIEQRKLKRDQLNIEAAVIHKDVLLLFNRGINFIIKLKLSELLASITDKSVPEFSIYDCELPYVNGNHTGFSGASLIDEDGNILITATSENTQDFIKDGDIAGSYVAIISANEIKNGMSINLTPITDKQGTVLKQKIESVAVRRVTRNAVRAYAVADNDNGVTMMFELIVATK